MPDHGSGRSPTYCVFVFIRASSIVIATQVSSSVAGACNKSGRLHSAGSRPSERRSFGVSITPSSFERFYRVNRSPVIGSQSRCESFILRGRPLYTWPPALSSRRTHSATLLWSQLIGPSQPRHCNCSVQRDTVCHEATIPHCFI